MSISPQVYKLIKRHEGFSAVAYTCPAGVWTIGYGHTKNLTAYTMPITPATAEDFLTEDVAFAEKLVEQYVQVSISQSQRDALVSFVFNIGEGNFRRSTLLKHLNNGNTIKAADQFLRWVYAGGKKQRGLEKRRKAEREMFLTVMPAKAGIHVDPGLRRGNKGEEYGSVATVD